MSQRLLFDIGDTVPASGTLILGGGAGARQPASSWSFAIITGTLSTGTANWLVQIVRSQGAAGTVVGQAASTAGLQAGPYLLGPGELLQIQCTGATAGAGVVGSVYGLQGLDPNSLPPVSAVPTVSQNVNSTITGPVSIGGNVPVINPPGGQLLTYNAQRASVTNWQIPLTGANATQVVALDPGCRSLAFTFAGGTGGGSATNLGSIQVIGNNTGIDYAYLLTGPQPANVGTNPTAMLYVEVIYAQDTSVNVIVGTTAAAGNAKVTITEIFDDEVVTPNNQQPAQVVITARNGSQTVAVDSVYAGLATVLRGAAPPWMSPISTVSGDVTLAAGGTISLIAAVTARQIYMHRATIYTNAATAIEVQLRDQGNAIVGTGNVGARGLVFDHDYRGVAPKGLATAGAAALNLFNPFGPGSDFQYTIDYTQAV